MSTGGIVPSACGFALENFTVQRASRSFCRNFAGLPCHSYGMRPALISSFSSFVFLCFGAAIRLESTISPDMAM